MATKKGAKAQNEEKKDALQEACDFLLKNGYTSVIIMVSDEKNSGVVVNGTNGDLANTISNVYYKAPDIRPILMKGISIAKAEIFSDMLEGLLGDDKNSVK